MSADLVQVQYDQMADMKTRFEQQSQAIQEMHAMIRRAVDSLRDGGWIGGGADAFYAEMEDVVEPAIRRLAAALELGGTVTAKASQSLSETEQEAAAPIQQGPEAAMQGTSYPGLGGGGAGGAWSEGGFSPPNDAALNQAMAERGFGSASSLGGGPTGGTAGGSGRVPGGGTGGGPGGGSGSGTGSGAPAFSGGQPAGAGGASGGAGLGAVAYQAGGYGAGGTGTGGGMPSTGAAGSGSASAPVQAPASAASMGIPMGLAALGPVAALVGKAIKERTENR